MPDIVLQSIYGKHKMLIAFRVAFRVAYLRKTLLIAEKIFYYKRIGNTGKCLFH